MEYDPHSLLASSTVATAPSPATSGTSLVVHTGDGALFAENQNCTVCPAGVQATKANSEIVRVTVIATDTFTIARTQEGSSARSIQVGDQIFNSETPKIFTDIEGQTAVSNGVLLSSIFQTSYDTTLSSSATTLVRIVVDALNLNSVTDISCPNLTTVDDLISISGAALLTTLDLSALQTVTNNFTLQSAVLTTLDLSALTTVGSGGILSIRCGTCTSLNLTSLTSAGGISFGGLDVTDINLAALTTLGSGGINSSTGFVTSMELTNLVNAGPTGISINEPLTSLNISSFTTGSLSISNSNLTSLNLSGVTTGNGSSSMSITNNSLLTSVTIASTTTCIQWNFDGDALTQTAVDNIIANLLTAGYANGYLNLTGGTNSTPNSTGLSNIATLTANGWNVTNN